MNELMINLMCTKIQFIDLKVGTTVFDSNSNNFMRLYKLEGDIAHFKYVCKKGAESTYQISSKAFNHIDCFYSINRNFDQI